MALPCLHALLLLATPAFLVAEEVCEELGLLQHMRSPKVLSTAPLPDLRGMLIEYGISGGAERVDTMNREERRNTMFYLLGLSKGQADGALQYGINAGHLPGVCAEFLQYGSSDQNDLLHCLAGRPCKEGLVDEPRCTDVDFETFCINFPVKGLPDRLPNDKDLVAFAYMALLASKLGLMSKCQDVTPLLSDGEGYGGTGIGSRFVGKGLCYMKQNFQDPKCPFDALLEVIKDQIEIEEIVPENLDVGVEELARIAQRVLQKDDGSRTGTIVSVDFDLQDGTLVSAGDGVLAGKSFIEFEPDEEDEHLLQRQQREKALQLEQAKKTNLQLM